MRTVLLGTDFVYNSDGNLIPIEINTSVGMAYMMLENSHEILDLTNLINFITSNNITKVTYIGALDLFSDALSGYCWNSAQIEYNYIKITGGVTVPDIEDNDTHLIIRSSYDYSAIVDDVYCRDKINFMNLIKNQSFGSQFAYIDDNEELVNNITTIKDNGNLPNFILKAIYPQYDREVYPKFFKVSNQTELDVVLQSIEPGYFLMEFHYNPNKLYLNDHMQIFRSLNILYPPNLDSISVGSYTMIPDRRIDNLNNYDSNTYELLDENRIKFLSSDGSLYGPKLLDTDLVYMADDTFKSAIDLQVGDVVKTLSIPNPNNIDFQNLTVDYEIDYETFVSGTTYNTNTIVYKYRVDKLVYYCQINFTDGTDWSDTINSSYLVLQNGDVKFRFLDPDNEYGIQIGDEVILVDVSSDTLLTTIKEVESVVKTKQIFSGWSITVEKEHLFLTKSATEETSYVSIEHNACGTPCTHGSCGKINYCCYDGRCAPSCPGCVTVG